MAQDAALALYIYIYIYIYKYSIDFASGIRRSEEELLTVTSFGKPYVSSRGSLFVKQSFLYRSMIPILLYGTAYYGPCSLLYEFSNDKFLYRRSVYLLALYCTMQE